HKDVSTSGKDKKETSHLDTITEDQPTGVVARVISQLERAAQVGSDVLKGAVKFYIRSPFWDEIKDETWLNVPFTIRKMIDRFDYT
ncbi:hypothetical protein, partial [Moorena sp. SIO4A5]